MFGVIGENLPWASILAGSVKCSLSQFFCQCRPDGKAAETLNPSLALFEVYRARAQIPMQELTTPNVKIQPFLSE